MSESFVTEFSSQAEPNQCGYPTDLLARLYREIGISAVAAALEAMSKPAASSAAVDPYYERRFQAFDYRDDLAA